MQLARDNLDTPAYSPRVPPSQSDRIGLVEPAGNRRGYQGYREQAASAGHEAFSEWPSRGRPLDPVLGLVPGRGGTTGAPCPGCGSQLTPTGLVVRHGLFVDALDGGERQRL